MVARFNEWKEQLSGEGELMQKAIEASEAAVEDLKARRPTWQALHDAGNL